MTRIGRIGCLGGFVLALAGCSDDDDSDPTSTGGGGGALTGGTSSGSGGTSGANGGSSGASGGTSGAGGGSSATGGSSGATGGASGAVGTTPMQQVLRALPTVRQEHAVVAFGGEIFVIGGFVPDAGSSVDAYNPTTDMWRDIADVPAVMHHVNAAVVGARLFIVGFHLGGGFTTADARVFEYDATGNAWTPRTPIPDGTERATACVAVLGDKIYLFGGARASTVSDASAYDTVMDTWDPLPAMPSPREHCVAGAIDGKLYIASGRSGGITGFQPLTLVYDPVTEMYDERAPITTPRGGTAGAALGGRLIVFGGEGNAGMNGVFPQIEAYDPASDTWQPLPDMLVPRHGFGAAVLGGKIYLPGGATSQGFGAVNDHTVFWFE